MIIVQVLLIPFLMFHSLVWAQTHLKTYCAPTNNSADNQFRDNLVGILLPTFYNAAAYSKFTNATDGSYPDQVFGLFLCRGDVSANTCQDCINAAGSKITYDCPLKKGAIIWYNECLIRYSDTYFFSKNEIDPNFCSPRVRNMSEPNRSDDGLLDMFSNLIDQAISNPSNYMYVRGDVNSTEMTLHGMVQCTPDLLAPDCRECLSSAVVRISNCSAGKNGGRILQPSCNIWYELNTYLAEPPLQPPIQPPIQPPTQPPGQNTGLGTNARVKIIASLSASLTLAILGFCTYYCKRRKRNQEGIRPTGNYLGENFPGEKQAKSRDFPLIRLDLIRTATKQFSEENKLGEGGFGPVYKGTLVDGKEIAVKRLSGNSGQGLQEFKAEVTLIARLQHNNLVKLLGCCLEGKEVLLVYDYMPNKSLDVFLFDSRRRAELDWKRRLIIINGIARGILYLHEDSRLRIIHRDLKASNVLLNHDMNPKISDFGMARIFDTNQTQAKTNRVVGTYGYMAPEYAMEGIFSIKSDVFSFGVLLLEIVSGRKNSGFHRTSTGHGQSLLSFAWNFWSEGREMKLMDPLLADSYVETEVQKCIQIGLLCVQEDPADRPTMSDVILMLGTYNTTTLPRPTKPAYSVGRQVPSTLS